jgi:hypothetical protein
VLDCSSSPCPSPRFLVPCPRPSSLLLLLYLFCLGRHSSSQPGLRPPPIGHARKSKVRSNWKQAKAKAKAKEPRQSRPDRPTDRPTDRTRGHEEGRVMGRDRFILPLLSICFIRFSPRPVHGSDASDATLLIFLANFLDSQCLNYFVVSFRFVAVFASSSKPYCSRSLNLHSPHTALHWWHAGVVVAVVM